MSKYIRKTDKQIIDYSKIDSLKVDNRWYSQEIFDKVSYSNYLINSIRRRVS